MANDVRYNPYAGHTVPAGTGIHPDTLDRYAHYNSNYAKGLDAYGRPIQGNPKPTGNGGGGHSGGGGGGGGGRRRVTGLEFFRPGKYTGSKNLMAQARREIQSQAIENRRQNNAARNASRLESMNAIKELQGVRDTGMRQAGIGEAQASGRLANVAMNRGMGVGQGYGANEANLADTFARQRGEVSGGFQSGVTDTQNTFTSRMNDLAEADRAFNNSIPSLVQQLYRQLYNDDYSRWMQGQQFALDAMQQRNSARAAMV